MNTLPTEESIETTGATADDGRRFRNRAIGIGVLACLTLAGFGIARAQTEAEAPTVTEPGAAAAVPPMFGRGPMMKHHMFGFGGGIHGEFTTKAPDGGWQTIATQTGEVTEVSKDSLTVKSDDGYDRTYVVDDDTLVNAGNDGIGDVQKGDDVHVIAIVRDGKAFAVDVNDGTRIAASREKWAPMPKLRERLSESVSPSSSPAT